MKIYNQDKTVELNEKEIDREKGYLIPDKLVTIHHEATSFIPEKTAESIAMEMRAAGKTVKQYATQPNKWFFVKATYPNGGEEVEEISPIVAVEAKDAYDEYEDIQVFIPYTAEQLKERADNKRHSELKAELAKIKEDIEQESFGLVRDDFTEKKARAAEIINELRVLEGKEPREVRPSVL